MYSCHLFLTFFAPVRSIPFLSFIVSIFPWNVPLVSLIFLKRSLLSHSIIFHCFFVLLLALLLSWGTEEHRRKEQRPYKRLKQTCLWVFGSLQWRCGPTVAHHEVRGTDCSSLLDVVCWLKSFWRRSSLLPLPLPYFGIRPNYEVGTQAHPLAENWIKDLLSMALPTRASPSFPHSQSLQSGCLHKPLTLIHQREKRMKTTITKITKMISWTTACVTLLNHEPCCIGPPKTGRSWWSVLAIHGPLEKGMANHFSILVLRSPWTVWKGKKVWHTVVIQ